MYTDDAVSRHSIRDLLSVVVVVVVPAAFVHGRDVKFAPK